MVSKKIEITEITVEELADLVAEKLLIKIQDFIKTSDYSKTDVYLTRTETIDFLKIDSSTLWHWTNKGKLKSYGIGHRRYYNKQEILDLLKNNEIRHR